jgi:hypothetical protein
MGIGRAVDAEDGLVDEVRSIGFERDVGAKMEEAGTLTKVTSGASAMGASRVSCGLASFWKNSACSSQDGLCGRQRIYQ